MGGIEEVFFITINNPLACLSLPPPPPPHPTSNVQIL